jgi:hypothetical protein
LQLHLNNEEKRNEIMAPKMKRHREENQPAMMRAVCCAVGGWKQMEGMFIVSENNP